MDGIDEASMPPIFKSLGLIEIVSNFFSILWFLRETLTYLEAPQHQGIIFISDIEMSFTQSLTEESFGNIILRKRFKL